MARVVTAETGGHTDRSALLRSVEAAGRAAADAGADLLVFPQLTTVGYFPRGAARTRDHYNQSERGEAESLAAFRVAASAGPWVYASYYETLAEGVFYCRAVFVRPDGAIAGAYRQVHVDRRPGTWETFYLQPGRGGFQVVETPIGSAGALQGADALAPEAWRAISGADLALVGLSEPADSLPDVLRQASAAAAANDVVVVIANRRGEEFGVAYPGGSTVFSPRGERLDGEQLETQLVLFEI